MLEFEDLNNSDLLFALEIIFTIIKAISQHCKPRWMHLHLYVGSFIAESAAGLALTALLFNHIVEEGEEYVHWAVFAGAGLIMATELMCIVSEARHVGEKARKRFPALKERQVWRAVLSWACYASAFGLCILHLALRAGTRTTARSWPQFVARLKVSHPLLVASALLLVVLVVFSIPSLCYSKWNGFRLFTAVLLLLSATVAAIAIILVRTPSGPGFPLQRYNDLDPISTFLLAIVSALTAISFWRLPSVSHSGLHVAHVRSYELAAFGSTAPTVLICFSDPVAARQVLVAVIPQIGVFTVPLVFSYLVWLWRSRKQQHGDDDDDSSHSVDNELQAQPKTPLGYGLYP